MKTVSNIAVLFFLCFLTSPLWSMPLTIRGQVTTSEGAIIEVGNVLLLHPMDSSLLAGALFEQGVFEVQEVQWRSFILKITSLGCETYTRKVDIKEKVAAVYDLGVIQLQSQMLNAVEVIGKQPLFKQHGTDLVVNVANSSLQNAGTTLDVLRQSPKVFVNSANQVSVVGKGAALLYIDGQQIPSNASLEQLSSGDIKEIQIIENPSAKYDAAGNAVINIITQKRAIEGYKIGIRQELEKRTYWRQYYQTNAYLRRDRWMWQFSYGVRPFRHLGQEYYTRTYDLGNQQVEIDNQFDNTLDILGQDYSFKTSFQATTNSELGLQYQGQAREGDKDAINRNTYFEDQQPFFLLNSTVKGPYQQANNTFSLYYDLQLDSLGSNLNLSAQYATFALERLEFIDQLYTQANSSRSINWRTDNESDIAVSTVQLDYANRSTAGTTWNAGLKNAYITNSSGLEFASQTAEGNYEIESAGSNEYDYDENILAGYVDLQKTIGPWNVQLGIRTEWTRTQGTSKATENQTLIDRQYLNVFPSFSASNTFAEDLKLQVDYNYRIQRPRFQDLNPFALFVDSLASLRGNPDLQPALTHNLSAMLKYKSYSLSINYAHIQDRISMLMEVADPENPGAVSLMRDNIDYGTLYAASLTLPFNTKGWQSYNVLGARLEQHYYPDEGIQVVNQQAGYYLFSRQSFAVTTTTKLDLSYQYTSPRVDGIYLDNPISNFGFSLSQSLWHKQLNLSFVVNDLFNKFRFTGISTFNNAHLRYLSAGDMRSFKVVLNWDFGKLGSGAFKNKKISQSELNRF